MGISDRRNRQRAEPYNNGQMISAQTANIFNPANGPLANYLIMGDSGSPCLLMILGKNGC